MHSDSSVHVSTNEISICIVIASSPKVHTAPERENDRERGREREREREREGEREMVLNNEV